MLNISLSGLLGDKKAKKLDIIAYLEKTDIEKIFDRLDGIEKKLSEMPAQRPVLTLKGRADERASKPSNE